MNNLKWNKIEAGYYQAIIDTETYTVSKINKEWQLWSYSSTSKKPEDAFLSFETLKEAKAYVQQKIETEAKAKEIKADPNIYVNALLKLSSILKGETQETQNTIKKLEWNEIIKGHKVLGFMLKNTSYKIVRGGNNTWVLCDSNSKEDIVFDNLKVAKNYVEKLISFST